MKPIIFPLIIAGLLLASCNESKQVITTYKWMVVHPDKAMYYCPVLKKFPDWRTLTDSQVAKLVLELHKNNLTCKSSLESIEKFLNQVDESIKRAG